MMKQILSAAGLAAVASAFTQPVQPPTYGSLLTPDVNNPIITGQTFDITWTPKEPSAGVTVSLVLCNGPGANCVLQNAAIVEGVSASAGKYSWNVPCDLPEGVQSTATGYGMLIIVDGTGEFQYSTQFSVQKGSSCSGSGPTTTPSTTGSSGPSTTSSPTPSGGWQQIPDNTTSKEAAPSTWTVVYSSSPEPVTYASPTVTYAEPSPTPVAATTAAQPSSFTGAAALPSAFLNVAGLVGAAGLAVFAL